MSWPRAWIAGLLSVAQGKRSVWAWLGGSDKLAFADVQRIATGEGAVASAAGMRSHPPVVLALGEPAEGLRGWRLTHQQAQAALVVALRRSESRGGRESIPFTRYADVALLASALKDELLARALLDLYIAPLDDSRGDGPALRETLRAYLAAERSVSSTAAALGMARKTVESRLRTIEERLGRTLHPCPSEIEVALELDELGAAPGSPQPPEISFVG